MELQDMSYDELKTTHAQIEELMHERRKAAIEEFKHKASQMDFDFESIFGKMNGSSPKYRNPDDPTQTYSRGKYPLWLKETIEAGHDLQEFAIG